MRALPVQLGKSPKTDGTIRCSCRAELHRALGRRCPNKRRPGWQTRQQLTGHRIGSAAEEAVIVAQPTKPPRRELVYPPVGEHLAGLKQDMHGMLCCDSSALSLSVVDSANTRLTNPLHSWFVGGRDFFNWLLDLPWKRVGVWALVIWFAYQLRDFFGVSRQDFLWCIACSHKFGLMTIELMIHCRSPWAPLLYRSSQTALSTAAPGKQPCCTPSLRATGGTSSLLPSTRPSCPLSPSLVRVTESLTMHWSYQAGYLSLDFEQHSARHRSFAIIRFMVMH